MKWVKSGIAENTEALRHNRQYVAFVRATPDGEYPWQWQIMNRTSSAFSGFKSGAVSQCDARRAVVAILLAVGAVDSQSVDVLDFMNGWGERKRNGISKVVAHCNATGDG